MDGVSRTDQNSVQAEQVSEKLTWCGEILTKKWKSTSIVTQAAFFIAHLLLANLVLQHNWGI